MKIKQTKPITKVYEIWTKYGFNYVWKHNGAEYNVTEDEKVLSYFVNYGHEGTLTKDTIVDLYVECDPERLVEYNKDFYNK